MVELVVVVFILAVLVVVAMTKSIDAGRGSEISVLRRSLAVMQDQIDLHFARHGTYPETLDPLWFRGRKLPRHPQNNGDPPVPDLHVFDADGRTHPLWKTLAPGVLGAYWYNKNIGVIRARVADQGSPQATIDFYNEVHQTDFSTSDLGNYSTPELPANDGQQMVLGDN